MSSSSSSIRKKESRQSMIFEFPPPSYGVCGVFFFGCFVRDFSFSFSFSFSVVRPGKKRILA